MAILLADDDAQLATFLSKSLESEGYSVRTALDESSVLSELARQSYQLIILDLNFGQTDGMQLLEKLRTAGVATPVMVLSARNHVSDRVQSLNLGADDYVTKPFSFQELAARANAILRRKADPSLNVLRVEDLELDPVLRKVRRGKREIKLSPKEFGLLQLLMQHAGQTISRRGLMQESWETDETDSNLIDVYVNYLRKKIDASSPVKLIQTVRGTGYRLGRPAPAGSASVQYDRSPRPAAAHQYPPSGHDVVDAQVPPSVVVRSLVHSIIHDLAQPLTSVRCFLEVLAMRAAGAATQPAELKSIEQQADRVIALTRGISAMVREIPAPAGPWLSLEQVFNEVFNDFALVMNSGLLTLDRQWNPSIQVPSTPVLRQLLVLLVSKLVGCNTKPVVLTVAASTQQGRCHLELRWRAADNSAVRDASTVLAKELPNVQEITHSLDVELALPEGQAAILVKLPAAPLAAAARADSVH
jgi:DNA-binding response OmpR family regulator